MEMKTQFSTGLGLAVVAVSSNLLRDTWDAISEPEQQINGLFHLHPVQRVSLHHEHTIFPSDGDSRAIIKEFPPKYNVIAIVTSPVTPGRLQEHRELAPSTEIPNFRFLCSDSNPTFHMNRTVISLFDSLQEALSELKEKVVNSAQSKGSVPYIITGHCWGGSIASLFTLWLLNTLDPAKSILPLCITFGSPPLGDSACQQAISQNSTWNSCFLHVVHKDDCFPRLFLHPPATNHIPYKPFGTTLLCSESGGACFEAPESIVELLTSEIVVGNQESQCVDYKCVIGCLEKRLIYGDCSWLNGQGTDLFKAGVTTQVTAVGLKPIQQQSEAIDALIEDTAKHEWSEIGRRRKAFDPAEKFNDMIYQVSKLEWYVEKHRANGPGYYDGFKYSLGRPDNEVDKCKTILIDYWDCTVKHAKQKPQIWGSPLEDRWLFAGNDFVKMVEPLEIADYYQSGRKDYLKQGRPRCFKVLEQWMKDHRKENPQPRAGMNLKSSLTEDSCFYAHVEEAIRLCRSLNRRGSLEDYQRAELIEFEKYVMDLIKKYAVSPDIFLEDSTFLQWWRVYEEILLKQMMGHPHDSQSELAGFMRNELYKNYVVRFPT